MDKSNTIAFPHPPGTGGPGSFQARFEKELRQKCWNITYANQSKNTDLIFIVGGTKKVFWLWKMKRKGVPVVFRLDGINWLHQKKKTSFKDFCIAEISNWVTKFIQAYIADIIVYQSQFVKKWWDKESWRSKTNTFIIYNAVNLLQEEKFKYNLEQRTKKRLVILEGILDYTPYTKQILDDLAKKLPPDVEIEVYGKFENKEILANLHPRINYHGFLERSKVYGVLSGSVYFSLDINPACPNTVIEALACGVPVVAFNTGAIPELIDEQCGQIIDYGSDPWGLKYPKVDKLVEGIMKVFSNYDFYAQNAYMNAKKRFEISYMIQNYNKVFSEAEKLKNL